MISREEYERLQYKAGSAVQYAVKKGIIPPISAGLACFNCGAQAIGYDHRDYREKLNVRPVCKRCNGSLPPALPAFKPERNFYGARNSEGGELEFGYEEFHLALDFDFDLHDELCAAFGDINPDHHFRSYCNYYKYELSPGAYRRPFYFAQ